MYANLWETEIDNKILTYILLEFYNDFYSFLKNPQNLQFAGIGPPVLFFRYCETMENGVIYSKGYDHSAYPGYASFLRPAQEYSSCVICKVDS